MHRSSLVGSFLFALFAWLLAASCLAQGPAVDAEAFRLASIFGDHMMLPPNVEVSVRGFGPAGSKVVVLPSWGSEVTVTIAANGRFEVPVTTPKRGTRTSLRATCGQESIAVRDVMIGDVWLASGQSNMDMPVGPRGGLKGASNWQQEVRDANHPTLRVFTALRQASAQPSDELEGEWVVCSPAVAAKISAVGYFFARDLVLAGKGPIGLVVSSWGGTKCEAWTSVFGLREMPEFADQIAQQAAQQGGADTLSSQRQRRTRFFEAANARVVTAKPTNVTVPEVWSKSGLGSFDGVVDYVCLFEVPEPFVGKELWLELGAIDDMDTVYWNGLRIGGMERDGSWSTPRAYAVPADSTGLARNRTVQLRVRVFDTGGEGGFTGKAEAMQLRVAAPSNAGVAAMPLAGTWQRIVRTPLSELPPWPRQQGGANRPAVLWNGMIEPFLPFPFTGCIWYQGESNRSMAEQYARLFPAMIRDWRRALGREVPFFFVQIAPYGYGNDVGQAARLRAAQAVALDLPNTGMAVTLDCGNARDIHPRRKQPVGGRLALLARALHYGDDIACKGPHATSATTADGMVRVGFAAGHGGLELTNDGAGFEVAGADGVFHVATAKVDGAELVLSCPQQAAAKTVRYAWHAAPAWSLRNAAGLPAAPFELAVR